MADTTWGKLDEIQYELREIRRAVLELASAVRAVPERVAEDVAAIVNDQR